MTEDFQRLFIASLEVGDEPGLASGAFHTCSSTALLSTRQLAPDGARTTVVIMVSEASAGVAQLQR